MRYFTKFGRFKPLKPCGYFMHCGGWKHLEVLQTVQTVYCTGFYASQKKRYFFAQTALTDFLLNEKCVYCAVRAESSQVIQVNFVHKHPASIPSQSLWDLWRTKWHWGMFFSQYFGSHLFSRQCSIPIFIYTPFLARRANRRSMVTFWKKCPFENRVSREQRSIFAVFVPKWSVEYANS
jgi:hypothetical protein